MLEPLSQSRFLGLEALMFPGISKSPKIFISQQNLQKQ